MEILTSLSAADVDDDNGARQFWQAQLSGKIILVPEYQG